MVVAVAVALAGGSGVAQPAPGGDAATLRASARTVLQGRCLPCHSGAAEGRKAKALAYFDLDGVDWSKTLSDEHLPNLRGRLHARGTPAELAQMQQFIDAELSARRAARAASPASAW
jgi:hypothetical protein